jgi:NitT/TauT family transport system permease protein
VTVVPEQRSTVEAAAPEFSAANLAPAPVAERERPSIFESHTLVVTVQLVIVIGLIGLWEYASGVWIRPFYLSKPSLIGERLLEWVVSGELWFHLEVTLLETLLGFFFGALLGFSAGLLLGRSPFLARVCHPFIVAINALPKVALAPLFILWFGIGLLMKVVLSVVIVFFLVFYNTFTGVRSVDPDLINIVRTMGAKRRHLVMKVMIPSALLWVFTGLRISIPYALIGAVVGEIFASNRGIGYLINSSASQFDTAGVFAGLLVLTCLATGFNAILSRVERASVRSGPGAH